MWCWCWGGSCKFKYTSFTSHSHPHSHLTPLPTTLNTFTHKLPHLHLPQYFTFSDTSSQPYFCTLSHCPAKDLSVHSHPSSPLRSLPYSCITPSHSLSHAPHSVTLPLTHSHAITFPPLPSLSLCHIT